MTVFYYMYDYICRNMAPKKSAVQWVAIKWLGNNSPMYDGDNHIDCKHVHSEDAPGMTVGKIVRIKWGERMWKGEVVVML